jgi:hypothetical protein
LRICARRLRYRLRRQSIANILFFWFVWVGHQTGQISFQTSLEMVALSLAKFIQGPNVASPQISREFRQADRIHGFQ